MTTTPAPSEDHADRETEAVPEHLTDVRAARSEYDAEIRADERKRIAKEMKEDMADAGSATMWELGWLRGMRRAILIIERGTGVAGEGEHNG